MSKPHPRSTFSPVEDALLTRYVQTYGSDWFAISYRMGNRTPRQCKERWDIYLRPDLNLNEWTPKEDRFLEECVIKAGRQWKALERFFPGRTSVNIKNRYNVILRRNKREEKAAGINAICKPTNSQPIELEPIKIESIKTKPINNVIERSNDILDTNTNVLDLFDSFFDETVAFEEDLLL